MNIMLFFIFELIKFMIMAIPVLMSVAYLTLAESKVMGYTQTSKGPNVVGIYGLLQPLADGVKLFSKEMIIPNHVSMVIYFFAPILALTLALVVWGLMPLNSFSVMSDMNLGMLLMFALSSMGVYAMLMSGWSSNSKYAFLGSLSAAAQMISYEVSMGLMMMSMMICTGSLNLFNMMNCQGQTIWFMFPLLPAGMMFFMSCLAETNSAPFDLTEGESELVSGYNVEYSSMAFALFFLAEYAHIMFMSLLFALMFLGGWFLMIDLPMIFFMKGTLMVFLFIWVSTSFPSLSYDQLMSLLWKTYLPLSLSFVMLTNCILWALNGLPPMSWI